MDTSPTKTQAPYKEIYLAGGCFWGTELAFRSLRGVVDTTVGYANGTAENPTYKQVCTGLTGHRETVQVVYDPAVLTLETILDAYFRVTDPTVRNQQAHDRGSQYQTGVYYTDPEDLPVIQARFEEEKKRHLSFYVELAPLSAFWPAEDYHQDYLGKNPGGYCHIGPVQLASLKGLNG